MSAQKELFRHASGAFKHQVGGQERVAGSRGELFAFS